MRLASKAGPDSSAPPQTITHRHARIHALGKRKGGRDEGNNILINCSVPVKTLRRINNPEVLLSTGLYFDMPVPERGMGAAG